MTAGMPVVGFIRQIVADDLAQGVHERVVTRFPPEPNGRLHIGHGKSICLNFEVAREDPDTLFYDLTTPVRARSARKWNNSN